jgi:hypothetical protein
LYTEGLLFCPFRARVLADDYRRNLTIFGIIGSEGVFYQFVIFLKRDLNVFDSGD